jgi:HPt (histidine-containing phosphotransfer) domain-containing protein
MDNLSHSYREGCASDSVLDVRSALGRLGGDEELLSDMIGFFVEDGPRLMEALHAAAEEQDAPAARKAAHSLKGLILGCGGVRAGRAAQAVEDTAYAGDVEDLPLLVENLNLETDALVEATEPYRRGQFTRRSHPHG